MNSFIGKSVLIIFLSGIVFLLSAGAKPESVHGDNRQESASSDRLEIFVSIPPQKYFARTIAGDTAEINVLMDENTNPHSFEPSPSQINSLSKADIYFTIGISLEAAFMNTIRKTLPGLKIVETSENIEKRHMESHSHDGETENGNHEGEQLDPHVWMSPEGARQICLSIRDGLINIQPENSDVFTRNADILISEIDQLDRKLSQELAPYKNRTVFVYHPAFGYFTEAFGLKQEAVETGGKEPTPRQMEQIIKEAEADGVKILIVQPQFSRKSAEIIARAMRGKVIPVNHLAEDWFTLMTDLGLALKQGL